MSTPEPVRQRRKDGETPVSKASEKIEKASVAARAKAEDSAFSLVDVARTIVFLLLASSALSYFVTRESFTWGVKRPSWATVGGIRSLIVSLIILHLRTCHLGLVANWDCYTNGVCSLL